jgi:radical SAM protein with 4Fe4S-binding SPASM domain
MKKRFKKVYIEITNCCNLSCEFCPKTSRKLEFITIDHFKHVLAQVKPYTDYIFLHLMGEPLLHPMLAELLDSAGEAGLKVNLTTNGTLLSKQEKVLLESTKLRQVNISLHSFEANENQISLTEYVNQVLDFVIKARESTKIISSIRLWNMDNLDGMNKDSTLLGANRQNAEILKLIEQRLGMNESLSERLKLTTQIKLSDQVYLNMAQKFDWPGDDKKLLGDQVFCYGLRDQIGILVDGTVVPCCLDSEGKIPLGNIYNQSFEQIIQSERATTIYEGFSKRIAVEELCKRCGYATRFNN